MAMTRELDPAVVARRLAALAASYVPETVAEGRARLRADALSKDAFASGVAQRLEELRALDELSRYLHRAVPPSVVDSFPGAYLDQTITAVGEAHDAHQGAIVLLSDRTPLYLAGLDEWDDAYLRKQVRVSGVLRRKQVGGGPLVNENGEHLHGMSGGIFVVEDPTWELA
jgi:hypothetical protein